MSNYYRKSATRNRSGMLAPPRALRGVRRLGMDADAQGNCPDGYTKSFGANQTICTPNASTATAGAASTTTGASPCPAGKVVGYAANMQVCVDPPSATPATATTPAATGLSSIPLWMWLVGGVIVYKAIQ